MSSDTWVWWTCRTTVLAMPVGGLAVVGDLRLMHLLVAATAGAGALWWLRGARSPAPTTVTVLLISAAVVANVLVLRSPAPAEGLELIITGAAHLGFALTVAACALPRGRRAVLTRDVATAAAVCSAWALVTMGPVTVHFAGASVTGRAVGPFSQPNELGLVCAASLPLAMAAALEPGRRPARMAWGGLTTALVVLGLAASMSRGAWIAGAAGLVVLAAIWPPYRTIVTTLAVLVALAGLAVAVLAPAGGLLGAITERGSSLVSVGSNPGDDRAEFWQEALRQFHAHPWLGLGPGSFTRLAGNAAGRVSLAHPFHPHNLYLEILTRGGVLLFALLTAFALALARDATRLAAGARRGVDLLGRSGVAAAPVAAVAAMAVHGLVDAPFANPIVRCVAWTVLALCIVHRPVSSPALRRGRTTPRGGTR